MTLDEAHRINQRALSEGMVLLRRGPSTADLFEVWDMRIIKIIAESKLAFYPGIADATGMTMFKVNQTIKELRAKNWVDSLRYKYAAGDDYSSWRKPQFRLTLLEHGYRFYSENVLQNYSDSDLVLRALSMLPKEKEKKVREKPDKVLVKHAIDIQNIPNSVFDLRRF